MDGPATPEFKTVKSRGILIPRDPAVMTPNLRRKLRIEAYDANAAKIALRCVAKGDTVLELGGGIGYLSTLIAKKREVKAVHTFEPNPQLAAFHAQMHATNEVTTVTTHNTLLAARKGHSQSFYLRENAFASSLEPDVADAPVVSVEQVEVLGLNAMMREIKPDILICDIQGEEAGLLPILKYDRLRGAIITLHTEKVGARGVRRVFEAMHTAGLACFPQWSEGKTLCFRKDWAVK